MIVHKYVTTEVMLSSLFLESGPMCCVYAVYIHKSYHFDI